MIIAHILCVHPLAYLTGIHYTLHTVTPIHSPRPTIHSAFTPFMPSLIGEIKDWSEGCELALSDVEFVLGPVSETRALLFPSHDPIP